MSKKRKSKVLAAILCATTVAAFYAAPVMAQEISEDLTIQGSLTVNGDDGIIASSITTTNSYDLDTVGKQVDEIAKKTAGINSGAMQDGNGGTWANITAQNSNGNNQITVGAHKVSTKINGTERIVTDKDGTTFKNVTGEKTTTIAGDTITTGSVTIGETKLDSDTVSKWDEKLSHIGIFEAGLEGAKYDVVTFKNGDHSKIELGPTDITLAASNGRISVGESGVGLSNGSTQVSLNSYGGYDQGFKVTTDGQSTTIKGGVVTANEKVETNNVVAHRDVATDKYSLNNVGEATTGMSYADGVTSFGNGDDLVTIDQNTGKIVATGTVKGKTGMFDSLFVADSSFVVKTNGDVKTDGSIQAKDITVDKGSLNDTITAVNDINDKLYGEQGVIAGISREHHLDGTDATVIEGKTVIGSDGSFSTADGKVTIEKNGRLSVNAAANIGGVSLENGDVVTNGYSLNKVGANTAGISRNTKFEITTVEDTFAVNGSEGWFGSVDGKFRVNSDGVLTVTSSEDGITTKIDGTSIQVGDDTIIDSFGVRAENMQAYKAEIGGVKIADGLVDGVDVSKLNEEVGSSSENIVALKQKTEGITREGETTTIEGTLSVSKDKVSTNIGGSMFEVSEDWAMMQKNGNVIAVTDGGVSLTSGATQVVVNGDGATFKGEDETKTVINGGAITAETINGQNIDELLGNVGNLGNNVAGITRDGETTTIEGHFSVSSDGTIDAFTNNSAFQMTENAISFGVNGGVNGVGSIVVQAGGTTIDGVNFSDWYNEVNDNLEDLNNKTQNINPDATHGGNGEVGQGGEVVDNGANTGFDGDVTVGGNVSANTGDIGGVHMEGGAITTGNTTINGSGVTTDKVTVGNTTIDKDKVTVGNEDKNVSVSDHDVVIHDKDKGEDISLSNTADRVGNLEQGMSDMSSRINKVEDRIDKVGAMAAAIANLRTMGYDPAAPTEIAVGVGQYRSETGAALGFFHYPNKNFMLSLSVSTSGDEVMGGIGATWKFGHKSPAKLMEEQKEKAAKAKIAKAEAMKKAALDAKVKAQQEKYAKMAAAQAKAAK